MTTLADVYALERLRPDSAAKRSATLQFTAQVQAAGTIHHQGWCYLYSHASRSLIRYPTSKVARISRRSEYGNIRVIPISGGHKRKALAL